MNAQAHSVELLCVHCKHRFTSDAAPPLICPACHRAGAAARAAAPWLEECQACACPALYRQRDFNRRLGLALVVLAALLALAGYAWGGFWAGTGVLIAATLCDRLLLRARPEVVVCYRCHAVHRGFAPHPRLSSFDLATHDAYRGQHTPDRGPSI
jgi:hypothetical protein